MDEIDEAFNDIILGEEKSHKEGYKAGFKHGQQAGSQEGYEMGIQMGAKIGSEIGFYEGFALGWRELLSDSPVVGQRKMKALDSLLELLESFPLKEPQHPKLQDQLDKIRAKFKQVSNLLHVQTESPGKEGLSF